MTDTTQTQQPWWSGKFILTTYEVKKDANADPAKPSLGQKVQPKRVGMIWKILAMEAGRAVAQVVVIDGTVTSGVFPLRFFPIESFVSSTMDTKPGSRVFDSYDSAVGFARMVGAALMEDGEAGKAMAKAVEINKSKALQTQNSRIRGRRNS